MHADDESATMLVAKRNDITQYATPAFGWFRARSTIIRDVATLAALELNMIF